MSALVIAFWGASLIGWFLWVTGDTGEYPERVVVFSIVVTVLAIGFTILDERQERW